MNEFLTLTCIGLLMIISPGPDFAIATKASLIEGRIAGLMAAVGISLANLCHVAINLLGIGVVISQSILIFTVMKVLGAGYLLYIGFKGLRAKPLTQMLNDANLVEQNSSHSASALSSMADLTSTAVSASISKIKQAKKGFMSGFFTSILNPKACLFYLSFFSVILSPQTPMISQIFYGLWLSFMALVWFMLVAIFFTNPIIGAKLKQGKHWIERFTGGVLVLLGIRLLSSQATE